MFDTFSKLGFSNMLRRVTSNDYSQSIQTGWKPIRGTVIIAKANDLVQCEVNTSGKFSVNEVVFPVLVCLVFGVYEVAVPIT